MATSGVATSTGFYIEPVTAPGSIPDAVDVQVSPDGRIFVLQKGGDLRVLEPDGTLLEEPWIVLWPEVFNVAERGLLGFALHPDFPATPDIYFVYTVDDSVLPRPETLARAYGRVTRYSSRADNPNRADLDSRHVILGRDAHDGIPSCFFHHSIGTVAFGADGSLFVGSGDGSGYPVDIDTGGQYPECFSSNPAEGLNPVDDIGSFRALDVESLAGKILRIHPETGQGYPDNPFYTGNPDDNASKVWAIGLRNPFRFSVVPPEEGQGGPGTLLIGDVGQAGFEELNLSAGGENFGWPCFEGPLHYGPAQTVSGPLACSEPRAGVLTSPYAYWSHNDPALSSPAGDVAFSITGGVIYPGTVYPEAYQGSLFLSDYAKEWVRAARLGEDGLEAVTLVGKDFGNLVDLTYEPATGTLLAADVLENHLVRIQYAGSGGSPPVARLSASEVTAEAPAHITFDATRSFDPDGGDLSFAWTFGDGQEEEGAIVEHVYPETGVYPVTVVVTDPEGQESRASLTVRVGRSAPIVTIESPTLPVVPPNGRVVLEASATDPFGFDGNLEYEWTVDLVHNDHEHRRFFQTDGPRGVFTLDPHAGPGETSHYRVTISVTDGEGLVTREVRTLRENDPTEIDVAPAGTHRDTGTETEVSFGGSVSVGRVGVPGVQEPPADFAVEVRRAGVWEPVRFPSVLPEPEGLQVLFVETDMEAVRVAGADTVAVFARINPDADLNGFEGLDVGSPVASGRSGRDAAGRLVLVGGGNAETGSYHLARDVLRGDGSVSVRVDSVSAANSTGGAGVALRERSDTGSVSIALLASPNGHVVLWSQDAEKPGADSAHVAMWKGPVWLRLERKGVRVRAFASKDGRAWERVASRLIPLPDDLLAGPAVTGGDREGEGRIALGWFGEPLLVEETPGSSADVTEFAIDSVVPNPVSGEAVLIVDAAAPGTYRIELMDLLGRVLQREPPVSVEASRQVLAFLQLDNLSSGVYIVRVVHEETGEGQIRRITVAR